jgi:hypothetical protein
MMQSNGKALPELSIVLVTDSFENVADVIEAFAAQTVKESIEIVIVLPANRAHEVDEGRLAGFAATQIVTPESIFPMPPARAAGVRAATAPVLFIGETHSFPHREFAAALIEAHKGPWDVVVPGLDNANPGLARSWASFLLDYGYWQWNLPPAQIGYGPTWNASYKTSVLLELDAMLDGALSSGDELPLALREQNRRFYFEPRAKIVHVNLESRGWVDERFLSGLVVGANRKKRWSFGRRLVYFFGSPLIPFVLIYRNAATMRLLYGQRRLPSGSAAAIAAGAVIRSVGEAVGYLVGLAPQSEARMEDYELNKVKYVSMQR